MKLAVLIAAVIAIASPAVAQTNWTSYQLGNQTHYTGSDQNGGMWNGTSYQLGNQTHSTFSGPGGQITNCTSYQLGSQMHTNCN